MTAVAFPVPITPSPTTVVAGSTTGSPTRIPEGMTPEEALHGEKAVGCPYSAVHWELKQVDPAAQTLQEAPHAWLSVTVSTQVDPHRDRLPVHDTRQVWLVVHASMAFVVVR